MANGEEKRKKRGFGSMVATEEGKRRQREIASKGGKAAHASGHAHEWTSQEATLAGRKGGKASHKKGGETDESREEAPSSEGGEKAA